MSRAGSWWGTPSEEVSAMANVDMWKKLKKNIYFFSLLF